MAIEDMGSKEDKNLLSLMLNLLMMECSSLQIKIYKLIRMTKIVKLE